MERADGWFEDPNDPSQYRFFDGTLWTDQTMPRPASERTAAMLGSPDIQASTRAVSACCAQCGSPLAESAVFCGTCGASRSGLVNRPQLSPEVAAERNAAMWAHLGPLVVWVVAGLLNFVHLGVIFFLGTWIPALLIYRASKSPAVIRQAKESLNFQFTVLLVYAIAMAPLALMLAVDVTSLNYWSSARSGDEFATLIVLLVLVAFAIFAIVQMIQGTVKAKEGSDFRYLFNLHLIRLGEPEDGG